MPQMRRSTTTRITKLICNGTDAAAGESVPNIIIAIEVVSTLVLASSTAGLEFGGTGLCSYRVRGVDGNCAEHLTVESYTVILTIIWYSITHSLFHSRLKTSLFCKSFPPQPFLFLFQHSVHGFPRLFTVISEHI